MACQVCNHNDLFTEVTQESVCSTCTMKYFNGGQATLELIAKVRAALGLSEGQYVTYDHGAEAARILGRR